MSSLMSIVPDLDTTLVAQVLGVLRGASGHCIVHPRGLIWQRLGAPEGL